MSLSPPQSVPTFRIVFTLVGAMEGFVCDGDETVDHAQMELLLEVQGALNQKLGELNAEHDLNLGVIDFQTRSIPAAPRETARFSGGCEDEEI